MRGCQWLTGLRIGKGNNLRVAQKDPGLDQKQKQSEGGRNITQRRVNSTLVTVLLFEGWTRMIVTRLSHIKIILYWTCDGHVVSILQKTVAASWSQTREKQAEFFFFFFSTIARINVDSVPFCKPQIVQFGNVCRENAGLMVRSGLRSEPLGYGWGKDDVLS